MAEELEAGCTRPSSGPVEEAAPKPTEPKNDAIKEAKGMIQVGKKAPNFTATGYKNGKFINFELSEHLGKWVLICFYPGDFTFV